MPKNSKRGNHLRGAASIDRFQKTSNSSSNSNSNSNSNTNSSSNSSSSSNSTGPPPPDPLSTGPSDALPSSAQLIAEVSQCAHALSQLKPEKLFQELFKVCGEFGGVTLLKAIVEEARKNELFLRTDSNTPPPTDLEYDLRNCPALVRLYALESMESKPLEDVFKHTSEEPEFTRLHLVSHQRGANPCPIYNIVEHKMASFKNLNLREKNNPLTHPSQNNSLFRLLSYLKQQDSFGLDIEYISRTPDNTATNSTSTPLPAASSAAAANSHLKFNEVESITRLPSQIFTSGRTDVPSFFPTTNPLDPLLKLLQGMGKYSKTDLDDLIKSVDYDNLNDDEKKMFNKFYGQLSDEFMAVNSPIMFWASINNGNTRTVASQTAKAYLSNSLRKCLLYLYNKRGELPESMQFKLQPNSNEEKLKALTALSHLFLSNKAKLQHEFLMAVLFKISPAGHFETATGTASSWTILTACRWLLLKVVELVLKLQPGTYPELEENPPNFKAFNMANLVFYFTSVMLDRYSGDTKTVINKKLILAADEQDIQLPEFMIGEKLVTTSLFVATLEAATNAMVDQLGTVLDMLNLAPLMRLLTNDKRKFDAILPSDFVVTGKGATIFFKEGGKVERVVSIEEIGVTIGEAIENLSEEGFHELIGAYQAFQEAKMAGRFMKNGSRTEQFATVTFGSGSHKLTIRVKVRCEPSERVSERVE